MNASKKSVHIFDEKLWPPPRKVSTIHTLHHNYYFNKVEQVNHEIKEERQVLFEFGMINYLI